MWEQGIFINLLCNLKYDIKAMYDISYNFINGANVQIVEGTQVDKAVGDPDYWNYITGFKKFGQISRPEIGKCVVSEA